MIESNRIEPAKFFETPLYIEHRPEFLDVVKPIADLHLESVKDMPNFEIDPIFPVLQTGALNHPDLLDFVMYVAQVGWNILNDQGYDMAMYTTMVSEIWAQQLNKHGQQFDHVHGGGSQISGFYFIEVPEDEESSFPRFKDPRPTKLQLELPIKNRHVMSISKNELVIKVKTGDIVYTNSWLEHAFVPNRSDKPFKFIHFNIIAIPIGMRQPTIPIANFSAIPNQNVDII